MLKRAKIQGFDVDLLSFDEVVEKAFLSSKSDKSVHIVTINPEIIISAKKNQELAKIINEAEIVTPDGVGIILALKFKGIIQKQVTGVDLSKKFIELCAAKKIKIALVGAKEEVLLKTEENIKNKFPTIDISYKHNGYFDDFKPIIENIINSGARFCLCAMGSPKQEYFLSELKKCSKGIVTIGVGGTFDVISGYVKQAPPIYRKMGLEWLYRTIKQPARFKRIFPTLPIFFFQSIIDSITGD